jgi:glycosyltransferase involved in cell wall biosynthesis
LKILYISQQFAPEMGAPSVRVRELATHWVAMGHRVTVLTAFPNHPTGRIFPGYRRRYFTLVASENQNGVRIVRTWLIPRPNRGTLSRLISFSTFTMSAGVTSLLMGKYDVVIGTSPPPFTPLAAWGRSRLFRSKFVLEVRDLWPESVVGSGHGTSQSLSVRGLDRIVRFLYNRADHIVATTNGISEHIVASRGISPQKVSVVPAAVDPDGFAPTDQGDTDGLLSDLEGKFIVAYVGTLGIAHGLDLVIDAARIAHERDPNVVFILVGDGAERDYLSDRVRRAPAAVRILPPQPFSRVPEILQAADVCLAVLQDDPVFRTAVPTKIYEYMAAGRPIVSNVPGDARELIETANAGVSVPPGDAESLAGAVLALKANPQRRSDLGVNGMRYVDEHGSWQARAQEYANVLERVIRD